MKSLVGRIGACALLSLAAACSTRSLQPDGGGGSLAVDGSSGGSTDGTVDGLFSGLRSYVVTSTLNNVGGTAGDTMSQMFTMIVDGDNLNAIIGANGGGTVTPVQPDGGGFLVKSFYLALDSPCTGTVQYGDLSCAVQPDARLHCSAGGTHFTSGVNGTVSTVGEVSVTGVEDKVAPTLTLVADGDPTDPFTPLSLSSSEPLAGQAVPVLSADRGGTVGLAPDSSSVGLVMGFSLPPVLARFGETYHLDVSEISDFAGNPAIATPEGFTTRAAPPLVAADGFESVTGATLGDSLLLSAADGDPVISGARSLYVEPISSRAAPPAHAGLELRLPVARGSSAVRFTYRTVTVTSGDMGYGTYFAAASVGGSIAMLVIGPTSGATTSAVIGGSQVWLGPITSARIPLPAGATSEIVIGRFELQHGPCAGPLPTLPGVIVDDLRTE